MEDEAVSLRMNIKCGGVDWDDDGTSTEDEEDYNEDAGDSWDDDDELQSFLEESTEFRAKIQYQVRVVALIPGFQADGSRLSAFSRFYKLRFGENLVKNTGFSSARVLCRSMPHVIRREALDKPGKVLLVESSKNVRIVAGIRSGLRRIVFNVLKQHPKGLSAGALDEECSELIGRPLSMLLLTELAYDTPNVECMVRDMADIASYRQVSASKVFLSSEAEDPALTDGIIICPQLSGTAVGDPVKELGVPSVSDILQARFKMTVLLAMHSSGIEITRLQKSYAELYTENLNASSLGFTSIEDLVEGWTGVIMVQESLPRKAFLQPSQTNCRILASLSSGLRLAVFSILLKCYPDGLEPAEVLSQLQETHADQISSCYGHASDSLHLGLHVLCFMVYDMMDFIGFGSREDGTLILKLQKYASFPVVDLPGCTTIQDEDESVELLFEGDQALAPAKVLVASFPQEQVDPPSPDMIEVLERRCRLILASAVETTDGMLVEEFTIAYKERSGQSLTCSQLKSFVSKTPGLVRMRGGRMWLVESPKNLRMVSVTRAGLRQVLYWCLLKNSGGVWSELVEGWFTDFTGYSLSSVLVKNHRYRTSRKEPLSPVDDFLQDARDLCKPDTSGGFKFYLLAPSVREDPAVEDARLLGLSSVEYSPVKLSTEIQELKAEASEEISIEVELPYDSSSYEEDDAEDEAGQQNGYDPPKAYATPRIEA